MDVCPSCDKAFKRLGQHWAYSPSHRPSISDEQHDTLTGLLMGDGWIQHGSSKNPFVAVEMENREYLDYLSTVFGPLSATVTKRRESSDSAKRSRKYGLNDSALSENYSDICGWQTRRHPEITQFDWYSSDGKVWPHNIKLTPTVLKTWYVCDGSYRTSGGDDYISISMSNEINNTGKVDSYFTRVNLPPPSSYDTSERERGGMRCSARFTVSESSALFDYMGSPIPGFEYKWPV